MVLIREKEEGGNEDRRGWSSFTRAPAPGCCSFRYLEELGQGIQHVASRVASLPNLITRANDFRAITGCGFTFLNIPRTYYGDYRCANSTHKCSRPGLPPQHPRT